MPSPTIDDLSDAQKRVLVAMLDGRPISYSEAALELPELEHQGILPVSAPTQYQTWGVHMEKVTYTLTPAGRELAERITKEVE